MELFSTLLAVVSPVVAAATAYYAFRQARSARDQAKAAAEQVRVGREQVYAALRQFTVAREQLEIDRKRFAADRAPRFSGVVEFVGATGHPLRLRLESSETLAKVDVRVIETPRVEIVSDGLDPVFRIEELIAGRTATVWVRVWFPYPPTVRIELRCTNGNDEVWSPVIDVPLFPELIDLTPDFEVELQHRGSASYVLGARLLSNQSLSSIEVELPRSRGVQFVRDGRSGDSRAFWGVIHPGEVAEWNLSLDRANLPEELEIKFLCEGPRGEKWAPVELVETPGSIHESRKPIFDGGIDVPVDGDAPACG